MDNSEGTRLTTGLRIVAMLLMLPALAPGWCCNASTAECGCCGNSSPPVSRPLCNCPDGCSCGQSAPTSQAIAKGRIQLRSQPTESFWVSPFTVRRAVDFYCAPSNDSPIAAYGAERCITFCRLNR